MDTLDDILKDALRARLIPTVADSRKEERIVSVLLATLSVVPPFAEQLLERCGSVWERHLISVAIQRLSLWLPMAAGKTDPTAS